MISFNVADRTSDWNDKSNDMFLLWFQFVRVQDVCPELECPRGERGSSPAHQWHRRQHQQRPRQQQPQWRRHEQRRWGRVEPGHWTELPRGTCHIPTMWATKNHPFRRRQNVWWVVKICSFFKGIGICFFLHLYLKTKAACWYLLPRVLYRISNFDIYSNCISEFVILASR